jgi:hypothetical protein
MGQRELKENHPILEKIVSALVFIPEIIIYLPMDFLQVPTRNWIIPRAVKRKLPFLSCRLYHSPHLDGAEECGPAKKYYHDGLFRIMCRHYDTKSGHCTKYKK